MNFSLLTAFTSLATLMLSVTTVAQGEPPHSPADPLAWGMNNFGQTNVPTLTFANMNYDQIAAGRWHSGGLRDDGTIGSLISASSRGTFGDGVDYALQAPRYLLSRPGYGPLGEDVTLGPRVAPQVIGLGLLEAVPAADLVARADPDDADADGISGRVHMVQDLRSGELVPGRFGWKATQPTVAQQTAAAFVNDMGLTTPMFPSEALSAAQAAAVTFVSGGAPEVSRKKLERVTFYCQTRAVPAQRRPDDPEVVRGDALFEQMGCAKCHAPAG